MAQQKQEENGQLSFFPMTPSDSTTPSSYDTINEPDAEVAPEHNVQPQKVSTTGTVTVKVEEKEKNIGFFNFDLKNSFILNFIAFISGVIGKAFRNSFTVYIFTSFNQLLEKFSDSFIFGTLTAPKAEKATTELKKKARRTVSNAALPSLFSRFFTALALVKARIYGYLFFAFGLTTLVAHFFVVGLVPTVFKASVYNPITAIILLLSAIFLIACGKTLADAAKDSAILSTLLFNFLGISRPAFTEEDEIDFPASGACMIGLVLGALTLFFPAHLILSVIFAAIYTFLVVKFPETGVISLILAAPFLYNTALLYISAVIAISYIFKIFTGKRTANFELTDIFTALFMILMLFSEIITFGSQDSSFMYTAFILVYFMCIIALKDNSWFERAINSVVLASFIFAAYSLFAALLGRTLGLDIEFISSTDLGNPEKTVISSTAILSLFVMCGIIFMLTAFLDSKSKSKKFVCMLLIVVSLVFLFLEASLSVIASLIIATVVYLVLISSKTVIFVVAAAIIIPLVSVFNSGVYSGISAIIESEAYRLNIYSAVVNMLTTYGFTGIGMAGDAFSELYATYYVGNTVYVPHAHSFLFQIAISLGIPGLILLIAGIFVCFQGAFSYGRNTTDKWSKNRLYCYAGMCSVLALILCGMTEHIAYNPRIFLLFWLMFGLTVAARRSARDATDSSGIAMEFDENYNG